MPFLGFKFEFGGGNQSAEEERKHAEIQIARVERRKLCLLAFYAAIAKGKTLNEREKKTSRIKRKAEMANWAQVMALMGMAATGLFAQLILLEQQRRSGRYAHAGLYNLEEMRKQADYEPLGPETGHEWILTWPGKSQRIKMQRVKTSENIGEGK